MAEKEVLSQEEIDALLNTVEKDSTSQDDKDIAGSAERVSMDSGEEHVEVLNFSSQERVVRGELPVLDKIHDRAARFFANDIYQLMAKDLQIKQEALGIVKHREFMSSLPNPTLMTIRRFKPLRGKALILFDNVFVYDLVDYYFGGSTQFLSQKTRTDFTATELRVMEIIIEKLVRNIEQAWAPIIKLEAIKVGDETNPQLVHIGEPNELLLVSRFNLDFGKESGSFSFVIPYSMVEPIKQQLELGAARPDDEIDPNWVMSLKEELMDVELTVSSVMAQTNSTLGKVMEWQVGDFIPMERNEEVTLDIEGTPGFTATMGSANDKRAVKIIKKISY
ncbi:flagellar motor switch protein FliM [Legionella jamestowniensis]|uniref:Flagellar motor switch protein FliM n=1 Tax=Legionella jamestowniensis TaxID=455 RepID=A0A0W0UWB0_9GAMM|nr:flagellar motor switch protein FliM [Legionella jamestowniensis]KTD12163.1 flagellar protein [Legionella jamestowniensis]OCH98634.1 flagellar motor switch protein FliM [Legionella jamestowniensis]SFL75343.1 flagellar motor switch protein FliM [Legionella jamestowniensis DSM 19215]